MPRYIRIAHYSLDLDVIARGTGLPLSVIRKEEGFESRQHDNCQVYRGDSDRFSRTRKTGVLSLTHIVFLFQPLWSNVKVKPAAKVVRELVAQRSSGIWKSIDESPKP